MSTPPELVPIAEACARLDVGRATLYRALADGKVPGGRQLGNRWIIARAVFDRWLVDGIEPETETDPETAPAPPDRNPFLIDISTRRAS